MKDCNIGNVSNFNKLQYFN